MLQAKRVYDLINTELPVNPMWIEGGILPKSGLLLFGGLSKIGKSFLSLNLARALVSGEPLYDNPEFKTHPARVTLIEHELGELTFQQRVTNIMRNAQGDWYDDFYYFSKEHDIDCVTPKGQKLIREAVDLTQPDVLILDPISKMLAGAQENDNSVIGEVFSFFDSLISYGRPWGMSLVIIHHFKKPPDNEFGKKGFDDLDAANFRGSSRFISDPDTLFTVAQRKMLPLPHKSWNMDCRFVLRHGEGCPDFTMTFNERRDCRIRWKGFVEKEKEGLPGLGQQSAFPKAAEAPTGEGLRLYKRV